jgi:1-deoxy-D-xylulose-5-phosphate reductoisomerase
MGPKISVDSATLMNKGLELIEAKILFDFPEDKIEIWIHPQSIVHGAIWLKDNSCFAQLSLPDMRSSIGYAMGYPERLAQCIPKMSFHDFTSLEFFAPDTVRFPALELARQALKAGPSHLVVLNAANEIAVEKFLSGELLFSQIPEVIQRSLENHITQPIEALQTIFEIDFETRKRCLAPESSKR